MATVASFCPAMISSLSIILLTITTGTQFTSQTLMWATMGARKQHQLEANLKLTLMSIWSLFCLDTNTSTCGLPSIDAQRPGYDGNI
uniref:Uncharacterized protein n=1 Tax=Triticum urartu TaxID=4572 RepID=A0A8R7UEZ1_TRIUA